MKNLNIRFDDREFEKLKALKDQSKLTWERFIFQRLTQ